MKKSIIVLALLGFIFSFTNIDAKKFNRYYRNIDVEYFYGALEAYGEWVEIGYDDYAWRPYDSHYNWRPYSDGRWEWTRHGWYWVSYEPHGWATYHYGRWFYDDYYGWLWMPDNVWGPAWVEWRYNDSYIGWSPLPPYARFDRRSGIHFSISWNSHYTNWNFVTYNNFVSYNVNNYFINNNVQNVYNRTKYRTNYFADNNRIVNGGINRRYVEERSGRRLTTRRIDRTDNFSELRNSRENKNRRIVDYRPDRREIESVRNNFDRERVVKGRTSSTLNRDKVVINRERTSRSGRANNEPKVIRKRESRDNPARKVRIPSNERNVEKRSERKSYRNNKSYERKRATENQRVYRKQNSNRERPSVNRNRTNENNVRRETNRSVERKSNSGREVYQSRERSRADNQSGNVSRSTRSSSSERRSTESKREIKRSRR